MLNFKFFIQIILMVVFMSVTGASANPNSKEGENAELKDLPKWDLSDLYKSQGDIDSDIKKIKQLSDEFQSKYKGKIPQASAETFNAAMGDYEVWRELAGRLGYFAALQFYVDMNDPQKASMHQNIEELVSEQGSKLMFFTLEINQMEDSHIETLLQDPNIGRYKVWLEKVRKFKPYQLSEAEELILSKKSITSNSAWSRLFEEYTASLKFELDGKQYNEAEILKFLTDPDEELRKKAYFEVSRVLNDNIKVYTLITNTLAKDKETDDSLRGIEHVMQGRNLANNIEDEVVDNLLQSVRDNYKNTSHRYYRLKAKLMGKERLDAWDRVAPIPVSNHKKYSWDEAKEIVLKSYSEFSPEIAGIGQRFFDNDWIDVPPAEGKMSGAFAASTITTEHPYLMLNFQGEIRDVETLAHELGHGIHQVLAGKNGEILSNTPLTLSETASVFGEQLTFRSLLKSLDGEEKMALLAHKIDSMLSTVVRQIAFCFFEKELHERRKEGDLSTEDISEIWFRTQSESFGDAIVLDDSYKVFWSYVPHFIRSPFYVYSYAFGDCLVNTLYMAYMQTDDKQVFVDKYTKMLEAGGAQHYTELLDAFGLNPHDKDFWNKGMGMIENLIDELEQMM